MTTVSPINTVQNTDFQKEMEKYCNKVSNYIASCKIFAIIGAIFSMITFPQTLIWIGANALVPYANVIFVSVVGIFSLICSVHLFVISTLTKKNKEMISKAFPNKPLGLQNGTCNCWLNALMQFTFHVPKLRKIFEEESQINENVEIRSSIKTLLNQYDKDQHGDKDLERKEICSITAKDVRKAFSDNSEISADSSHQEDVSEPLGILLNFMDPERLNKTSFYSTYDENRHKILPKIPFLANLFSNDIELVNENIFKKKSDELEQVRLIPLSIPEYYSSKLSLSDMLNHYMNNQDRDVKSEFQGDDNKFHRYQRVREELKFTHVPEDLFFSISRFRFFDERAHKINDDFELPLNFKLDEKFANCSANYELDAFMVHLGDSDSGHYISYVKDKDGHWFECNDSNVTYKSEDEIAKIAKQAYVLHYHKK